MTDERGTEGAVPEPNKPGLMPQENSEPDRKGNEAEPLRVTDPDERPNSTNEPER